MRRIGCDADELGECPTWDDRSGRLLRIDVTGRRLTSCDPEGAGAETIDLPEIPGSIALREDGGLLVAYRRRLAVRDHAGTETDIALPESWDRARERFNDGACDPGGRFWVGTMDRQLQDTVGALYRVDPDLTVHRIDAGFGLSNGIAWSPDGSTMYFCDSRPAVIYAYDFDVATGQAENRRVLVEFTPAMGMPDGCATDAGGYLWVAAPDAGQLMRFDAAGRLERKVDTQAAKPTSVAFGGSDLRTLFVTSMVPRDGAAGPADGGLFAMQAPAGGVPKGRFAA
jgi:L-arabinonolactonase